MRHIQVYDVMLPGNVDPTDEKYIPQNQEEVKGKIKLLIEDIQKSIPFYKEIVEEHESSLGNIWRDDGEFSYLIEEYLNNLLQLKHSKKTKVTDIKKQIKKELISIQEYLHDFKAVYGTYFRDKTYNNKTGKIDLDSVPESLEIIKDAFEQLHQFLPDLSPTDFISINKDTKSNFKKPKIKKQLLSKFFDLLYEAQAITLNNLDLGIEDKKRDAHYLDIEIKKFLSELFKSVTQSAEYQTSLRKKLSTDFSAYINFLRKQNVEFNFLDEFLGKKYNDFLDNNIEKFITLQLLEREYEKCVHRTAKYKEVSPYKGEEELSRISQKINNNEKKLENYKKQIELCTKELQKETANFLKNIMKSPYEETFKDFSKECGLDFSEISSSKDKIDLTYSTLTYGFFTSIKDYFNNLNTYLPSMQQVKKEVTKATQTIGTGFAVTAIGTGLGGGIFGAVTGATSYLGYLLIKNKLSNLSQTFGNTVWGEITLRFSSEEYKVNKNMISAFGEYGAQIVCSFYVKRLMEMEVALQEMSESDKQEFAPNLTKEKGTLKEHLEFMRSDSKSTEKNTIFQNDIKKVMKEKYEETIAITYENTEKLREAYEIKKTLGLQAANEPEIDPKKSLAIQNAPKKTKLLTLEGSPKPRKLLSIKEKRAQNKAAHSPETSTLEIIQHDTPRSETALTTQINILSKDITPLEKNDLALSLEIDTNKEYVKNIIEEAQSLVFIQQFVKGSLKPNENEENFKLFTQLRKTPLEFDFIDHFARFVGTRDPNLLLFWFKEKFFAIGSQYYNSAPLRLKVLQDTLPNGKSLWHYLCEIPNGHEILQNIIKLAAESMTTLRKWKFSDYFDPTVKYNNTNPLEYALQTKNMAIINEYITNMLEGDFATEVIHKTFRFLFTTYPNSKLFYDILMSEIGKKQRPSAKLSLEIFGALSVYLCHKRDVPTSKEDIVEFLNATKIKPSLYITIPELNAFQTQQDFASLAQTMANHISDHTYLVTFLNREDTDYTWAKTYLLNYYYYCLKAQDKDHPPLTKENQELLVAILKNDPKQFTELSKKNSAFLSRLFPQDIEEPQKTPPFNLLYLAAKLGRPEIVGALYDKSINVDAAGFDDEDNKKTVSALIVAAKHNHPEVVIYFMENAAKYYMANYRGSYDLTAKDAMNRNIFHYLAMNKHPVMFQDKKIEPCIHFIESISFPTLKSVCNVYDVNGKTPLHYLVESGNLHVLKKIHSYTRGKKLERGIFTLFTSKDNKVNAFLSKEKGDTPIIVALKKIEFDNKDNASYNTFDYLHSILCKYGEEKEIQEIDKEIAEIVAKTFQSDFTLLDLKIDISIDKIFDKIDSLINSGDIRKLKSFYRICTLCQNVSKANFLKNLIANLTPTKKITKEIIETHLHAIEEFSLSLIDSLSSQSTSSTSESDEETSPEINKISLMEKDENIKKSSLSKVRSPLLLSSSSQLHASHKRDLNISNLFQLTLKELFHKFNEQEFFDPSKFFHAINKPHSLEDSVDISLENLFKFLDHEIIALFNSHNDIQKRLQKIAILSNFAASVMVNFRDTVMLKENDFFNQIRRYKSLVDTANYSLNTGTDKMKLMLNLMTPLIKNQEKEFYQFLNNKETTEALSSQRELKGQLGSLALGMKTAGFKLQTKLNTRHAFSLNEKQKELLTLASAGKFETLSEMVFKEDFDIKNALAQDEKGFTILHYLMKSQDETVVPVIVAILQKIKGPEVEIKNHVDETPYDILMKNENKEELIKEIKKKEIDISMFFPISSKKQEPSKLKI